MTVATRYLHQTSVAGQDLETESKPRFIVIKTPTSRPTQLSSLLQPDALAPTDLLDLHEKILTFETSLITGNMIDEIALTKPDILEVSSARFQQIATEVSKGFQVIHLKQFAKDERPEDHRQLRIGAMNKAQIVDFILRRIWNVKVFEEIAAEEDLIRQTKIKSTTKDIIMLISEAGKVLRSLAKKFGARITVNIAENSINLTGTRKSLELTENAISWALGNIIHEDIDMTPLQRIKTLDESSYTYIQRLTKTYIEPLNNDKVRIWTMGPRTVQIDEAKRLLLTSLDIPFRESYSLLCETKSDDLPPGALYPFYEQESLQWRYRIKEWFRWRNVKTRNRQPEASEALISPSLLTPSQQSLSGLSEIKSFLDEQDQTKIPEEQNHTVEYYAVVGGLLHAYPPKEIRRISNLTSMLEQEPPRVLCNTVPHIMKALNVVQPYATPATHYSASPKVVEKTFFLIKFAPSPWSNPEDFEALPTVEVEIVIDPYTGELSTPRIHAISSHATADVLMPDAASDVRYVRRVNVPLDASTPEVDEFMQGSNLDVFRSDVLRPAAKATFEIPGWLAGENENQTVQKEYIYTHLEYKSGVQFDWRGLPLWFTDIESGSTGGKRSEVMIEYQQLGHGAMYKSARGLLGNEQAQSELGDYDAFGMPRDSIQDKDNIDRFLAELDDTGDDMSMVDDALFALEEPDMAKVETNQDIFSAPIDDLDDDSTGESNPEDHHRAEEPEDMLETDLTAAAHGEKLQDSSLGDHSISTWESSPQSIPFESSSPSSKSTSRPVSYKYDDIDLPLVSTNTTISDDNAPSSTSVEDFTSFVTKIRNFISQLQPEIKRTAEEKSSDDNSRSRKKPVVNDEIPLDKMRQL